MQGKTLVLGVTGGISVYKVPELISRLRKNGLSVEVIMTDSATEFVTPLTFREISQNPVHTGMFSNNFQWNVEHIALAKKADLMAVIPATANIIGKIANGIADDLLSTTIMASRAPKLIAPAMNTGMYENPIVQKNLLTLESYGFYIVGPDSGGLLCGDQGMGRLSSIDELEISIQRLLSRQDLAGETVLVTAGGTREPLDPVRYIANRSSGKMGHALAESAFKRGAKVILISTSEDAPRWKGMQTFLVDTALEMRDKVLEMASQASIIIKAAAPADFRPESFSPDKIKKSCASLNLKLILNPDILSELGRLKTKQQLLVGFAAETTSLRENALQKLTGKNLDLIIGNLVNEPDSGMGSDFNRVIMFSGRETLEIARMPKNRLAEKILNCIISYKRTGAFTQDEDSNC